MFLQLLSGSYGLLDMLTDPSTIASMICMILGVVVSCLAMRITKAVRKSSNISSDDKLLLTLRGIGLVLMLCGLSIMMITMITGQ